LKRRLKKDGEEEHTYLALRLILEELNEQPHHSPHIALAQRYLRGEVQGTVRLRRQHDVLVHVLRVTKQQIMDSVGIFFLVQTNDVNSEYTPSVVSD
jgi:hypothetical protein